MIMKSCLLAIVAACLAVVGVAQVQPDVKDIEYARADSISLRLDLYFPGIARPPYPLVVWIHGGGWRAGNKAPLPPHAATLLERGYAVASINYRLSGQAIWPAQIHDCKGAIRWLRAHAPEYNLDPRRIGVWGSSAGGHLVAMLGTSMNVETLEGVVGGNLAFSSDVQAVCDWYGPSDLLTMGGWHDNPDSPEAKLIGGPVQDNPGKAWAASPVAYVNGDEPPFLIMHGTKDKTVPFSQSEELRDSLLQHGVDVIFHPVEGAGHGGKLFRTDSVLQVIHAFFDRHLKGVVNSVERNQQTKGFHLYQNYPNPFGPGSPSGSATTMVRFTVPEGYFGPVRLAVLDLLGRNVKVIFDGKVGNSDARHVQVSLPGLASGLYVFRLGYRSGVDDKMFLFMK